MHLHPNELDKLIITQCGLLAQRRLARGVRLNYPEAVALISCVTLELIRDGVHTVSEIMAIGRTILGLANVLPGVSSIIDDIQVEATFRDGTKLVTIHSPIENVQGDLQLAMYGSFLPVPSESLFPANSVQPAQSEEKTASPTSKKRRTSRASAKSSATASASTEVVTTPDALQKASNSQPFVFNDVDHPQLLSWSGETRPGQLLLADDVVPINAGKPTVTLTVTNMDDRPIQIGSHYHFVEANPHLSFDRLRAYGYRLNIAAGTAVRFEPGEKKVVTLVAIGGRRVIRGGNLLALGPVDPASTGVIQQRITAGGFRHADEPSAPTGVSELTMSRSKYSDMVSHR